MGYVSRRTFSLRGFKSTQILMSPDRFGTTTMPAHHEVGSVTLLITPIFSIRSSSSRTFLRKGRVTLRGVYGVCGTAFGFRQIVYSSPMLPRPSKTFGKSLTMSSSVEPLVMASTRQSNCRAVREGRPNRLTCRSFTTYTLCLACRHPWERSTVNCLTTGRILRAGL